MDRGWDDSSQRNFTVGYLLFDLWRDSRQTPLISSLIPQSRRECGYLQG